MGRCWIEGRGVTVKGRCGEMLDRGAGGYCQREMWGDVGWRGGGLQSKGDVGRCWIEGRGVTVKGRCGEMLDRGAGGYSQREMWGDVR